MRSHFTVHTAAVKALTVPVAALKGAVEEEVRTVEMAITEAAVGVVVKRAAVVEAKVKTRNLRLAV